MPDKPVSRRRFLQPGCITAAAASLTVCGVAQVLPGPPPIELPSRTYGKEGAGVHILLAYATYAGSTADISVAIGETLGASGLSVDVRPVTESPQVDGYQAVLVGSAVHGGRWLAEACDFVAGKRQALGGVPVALFCVHVGTLGDDARSVQGRRAYLDDVRPLLQPVAEGYFADRFDRRGAARLLPRVVANLIPSMDFIQWDRVRAWAEDIRPLLG